MSLVPQIVTVVATPSKVLDFRYPDGNDGSAATMTWATVPNFSGETGSFSHNLASYLTQTGGATFAILSGTLVGDWALSSAGLFTGTSVGGPVTLRVRATIGSVTADCNSFIEELITTPPDPDVNAPTNVTGYSMLSRTSSSITVQCDAPADVPYSTQPAQGMKEVRFFNNGSLDGVVSLSPGLKLKFAGAECNVLDGRRFPVGDVVRIPAFEYDAAVGHDATYPLSGVPGGHLGTSQGLVRNTDGPACAGVVMIAINYDWKDIETALGVYAWGAMDDDLAVCHALGVYWLPILNYRTFAVDLVNHSADPQNDPNNPMPSYSLTHGPMNLPPYCTRYTPSGGGFQGSRWDPEVLAREHLLINALATRFDKNTGIYVHFAGLATQETACNMSQAEQNAAGFTDAKYFAALENESTYISTAFQYGLPYHYHNYFTYDGSDPNYNTQAEQDAAMDAYCVFMESTKAVMGGPDILKSSAALNSRVYPRYELMRSRVRKFCSMQNDSYTASESLTVNRHFGRDTLFLSQIWNDWRRTGSAKWFEHGSDNMVAAIAADMALNGGVPGFGPDQLGTVTQTGNDYSVKAYSSGINAVAGGADQYSCARASISGNFTFTTILQSITSPAGALSQNAVAGLCVRDDVGIDQRAVHLYVTSTQIVASYRSSTSGAVSVAGTATGSWSTPTWLQIRRNSLNQWSFFYSKDGGAWIPLIPSGGIGGQQYALVTMTDPVLADCFAASMNWAYCTALFKDVCLQNLAPITYTFAGLSGGTSYSLMAKSRDLASTPNDSSGVTISASTTAGGVTRKWDPGLYVFTSTKATTADDASSGFNNDLTLISAMAGVKGICYAYSMRLFEPVTQGVYDFTVLDRDINRVSSAGKKMGIRVLDRVFSGTTPVGGAILPDYLLASVGTYGAGSDGTHSGYWNKTSAGYIAACWRASVMDRYIALIQALAAHLDPANGQTLDNSANIAWVEMPVTDLFLAAGSDYTTAAHITQLKRFLTAAVAAWPHTPIRLVAASLTSGMSDLVNTTKADHAAIGSLDVKGINTALAKRYFDSQLAWCGTLDGTSVDQRGLMPIIQQVGTGEMDGSLYAADGSPYSLADLQSTLTFLGTNYAVWQIVNAVGNGNWTANVKPFLIASATYNATRPTGW